MMARALRINSLLFYLVIIIIILYLSHTWQLRHCVVPFCHWPPTPWNFHCRGWLLHPLPPPTGIWEPHGRNISDKSAVALYYYAKHNCLCNKTAEKKHFIHVNEVSNNLNFQLRVVTKNINMEAMTLAYLHVLSHKTWKIHSAVHT